MNPWTRLFGLTLPLLLCAHAGCASTSDTPSPTESYEAGHRDASARKDASEPLPDVTVEAPPLEIEPPDAGSPAPDVRTDSSDGSIGPLDSGRDAPTRDATSADARADATREASVVDAGPCGQIQIPDRGTDTRNRMLTALHAEIDPTVVEIGKPLFVLTTIRTYGDQWGYLVGSLCLGDATNCVPVTSKDLERTAYWGDTVRGGAWDGNVFFALERLDAISSSVVTWSYGPNEPVAVDWPAIYGVPQELIDGCP